MLLQYLLVNPALLFLVVLSIVSNWGSQNRLLELLLLNILFSS